jgi:integrase
LSDEEEVRLRAAIGRWFKKFLSHFLLSVRTGMRMSEQYGLQWSQIDFERRQIQLPKTKNGDPRTTPLNSVALAALNELHGEGKRVRSVPLFPSARSGGALQGSRGWFPGALEEAKVEGYTWHCNRQTFASRLVMAGVALRNVAELLGRRTLQMVMRYSHLAPEHQASAVDRLVKARNKRDTKPDTGGSAAKAMKRSKVASS